VGEEGVMGIVSSTGIGSGIDIQSLVTQLAKAEAQPGLNAVSRQKTVANTRLSGLGTLKSALSDLRTAVAKLKNGSLFKTYKSTSSDESVLKVTTGLGAVPGSYSFKVNQLATAQKSITTTEFINDDPQKIGGGEAKVGEGELTFGTNSGLSFKVNATSTTTLEGLRDAINQASGNSFVTATIVNIDHKTNSAYPVGDPLYGTDDPLYGTTVSKLVLTGKNTGAENGFTVSATDIDGNHTDASGLSRFVTGNLESQVTPKDAQIEVDGQIATRSSNSITDVLSGVTLELKAGSEGKTTNVDISLDNDAITAAINEFVTAYNKFSSTSKSLGQYGGSSDGSGSGNGPLIGNSTLRLTSSLLRQDATAKVQSVSARYDKTYNSLAMIGVTVKDGVMSLDSAKLNSVLSTELPAVSEIFTSANGVATRMNDSLNSFLESGGALDTQQNSLKKQLSALESRKLAIEARQSDYEAMLLKQFTAMDVAVGAFNSTSTFLNNWIQNS